MNNILGLLLLILFGGAGLISIFIIINLLLPAPVKRTRAALENSLGRSLLLGLVNSILAVALSALLSLPTHTGGVVAGIFVFLIGLVALAVLALTLLGLVAVTALLGSRLAPTKSAVASHLLGGVLLLLACLTPYLGWFVFTPLVVWSGLGAAILTLARVRAKPQPVQGTK
jgi:hypothetical protein